MTNLPPVAAGIVLVILGALVAGNARRLGGNVVTERRSPNSSRIAVWSAGFILVGAAFVLSGLILAIGTLVKA